MEFKEINENLTFVEQQISTEPSVNVLTKDQFEVRVKKVFEILWEKLSKSFGPGGAGTFISIYPNYYNTKDGFTIMKNIAFDKKLDQVICDIVSTICNRLNFTVGDGTTTAVIATRSTYEAYQNNKEYFEKEHILPRDILKRFDKYKTEILDCIDSMALDIRSNDPKVLRENIEKVVSVSSNGDEDITKMIADLYEELMYPAITCILSKDGTMKSSVIEGYKLDICLTDKMYTNNDDNTMRLDGSDIIMFDHKITKDTYENILRPLSSACRQRGRHLICIAPFYDETALRGVIGTELNAEYKKTGDINLVMTVCTKATGYSRTLLGDLAMLLNTEIISPEMENEIITGIHHAGTIYNYFDLDHRHINDIQVAVYSSDKESLHLEPYNSGVKNIFDTFGKYLVGYCDKVDLGLKDSIFTGFYYDETLYNKHVTDAKFELAEVQKKCEKIGTFSVELGYKQQRVYALGLKNGIIEVGATSEISQGYLKDVVDDAVKSAASAYNNGVVLGCNVTLLKAITQMFFDKTRDELDIILLNILIEGYRAVYKTVFGNVFNNCNVHYTADDIDTLGMSAVSDQLIKTMRENTQFKNFNLDNVKDVAGILIRKDQDIDLYDALIDISIYNHKVLDMSTGEYSTNIINSAETDKEILKATIDLLSLLITGNQLVLR